MNAKKTLSFLFGIAAIAATAGPALADEYITETRSFSAPLGECSTTKTTTTTLESAPMIERRTVLEQPVVIERPAYIETAPLYTKEKVKINGNTVKIKEYY